MESTVHVPRQSPVVEKLGAVAGEIREFLGLFDNAIELSRTCGDTGVVSRETIARELSIAP